MTYQSKWYRTCVGVKAALVGAVVAALAMLAAPVQASTITADPDTLNINGGDNPLSVGDNWLVNITGENKVGFETMFMQVTATEDLTAIETNTLNLPAGFADPTIQWNSEADGTGTVFASLSSAELTSGSLTTMVVSFLANETKYLIATWEGIGPGRNNWDVRIEAIPLPAGLLLFLSGLAGVGFLGRYKARRREAPAAA